MCGRGGFFDICSDDLLCVEISGAAGGGKKASLDSRSLGARGRDRDRDTDRD